MSGIAGIYRHSFTVELDSLASMISKMAHRGPDGQQVWAEGSIGLAACLLKVTPESENETPITCDLDKRFRLVWDGRLDNREELVSSLSSHVAEPNLSDPDLFILCFQLWGADCVKHLVGDFSFALWDTQEEMLFVGRDQVGLKPFHYSWDGKNFYFSSEIKPLIALLGIPDAEEDMVLSFLSYRQFTENDHQNTFLKGIKRLPPGHCLLLKQQVLSVQPYASWNLEGQGNFKSEAECIEKFRGLFEKSVKARLRSRTRITTLLSGGHDSSAIVATAAKVKSSASELDAINYYSDDEKMDERTFARHAAESAGISFQSFFAKTRHFSKGLEEFLERVELPMINTSRNLEPYEILQERGVRVILSGEGGDQVLDEFGLGADLLAHGKFLEFFKRTRSFSKEFNDKALDFQKESLRFLIPKGWLNFFRRVLRNVPAFWLNQEAAKRSGLLTKVFSRYVKPKFNSYNQEATFYEVTKPYSVMKLELEERIYASHGMEIRYPFLDSRLIQFMLNLPWQFRSSGIRKKILKDAMQGLVPEVILNRKDKADHTSETDLALESFLKETNPESLLNTSGRMQRYVDLSKAERLISQYRKGQKNLRFEIWFLITMDRWLQQFSQGVFRGKEKRQEEVPTAASH